MANQEYEWPKCWVRGEMSPRDLDGDLVRQMIQACQHRVGETAWSIFGRGMDYHCEHPAIGTKDEVEGPKQAYGGLCFGGLSDDYATFCPAVDYHLTSLGEPSRLIIDPSPIYWTHCLR